MSSTTYKRAGIVGAGIALCAFFAMQGCGSDSDTQSQPPPSVGGGSGNGGSAGSSSGSSGSSGSSSGASGSSGSSGSAGASGSSGSAGSAGTAGTAGTDCGDAKVCYKCAPSTNDQFHNHCGTGACDCAASSLMCTQQFDNGPLNLPAGGTLPALVAPTNPT